MLWIVLALAVALILFVIGVYNSLITLGVKIKEA